MGWVWVYLYSSYTPTLLWLCSPRLYNRSAVVSSMQTRDPPIVSHTKLTSRLRCIPSPNSYRYWLGLGLGLGLCLSLDLCLGLSLGLSLSLGLGLGLCLGLSLSLGLVLCLSLDLCFYYNIVHFIGRYI